LSLFARILASQPILGYLSSLIRTTCSNHHHDVHEGLGVFPVP
jgi:hypothetical protein